MREDISHKKCSCKGRSSRESSVRHYSLLIIFLLVSSCSGTDTPSSQRTGATNRPPSLRTVKILPATVTAGDVLSVQVEAHDPDRNPLTFKYQWFINELQAQGETQPTLSGSTLKRGDHVSVEVIPFDGTAEGVPLRTESSLVINAPPYITHVEIEPIMELPEKGVRAKVDGADADRDEIHYVFRWWGNDKLIQEGEAETLPVSVFTPRDVLIVEVIPHDAASQGNPVKSIPFTIGNSPPKILSLPRNPVDRGRYEYMVQAMDPEGDPIAFNLEVGPPGMVINKMTGEIVWEPPSDMRGTFRVKIVVEDKEGGSAFQEFTLVLG